MNMANAKLKEGDRENLLKDRKEGMSYNALGRKYNISPQRAASIVQSEELRAYKTKYGQS